MVHRMIGYDSYENVIFNKYNDNNTILIYIR